MLFKITEFTVKGFTFPIHSYGVLIVIGFLCGLFVAWRRAKRLGLEPGLITDIGVAAIIAGMLGAKAFYLIENRDQFGWALFNLFDGGFSANGAWIGLAVGAGLFLFFRAGSGLGPALWRDKKRRTRFLITLLLFLAFASVVGARAAYVRDASHMAPGTERAYDTRMFDSFGSGFVFYGGILPAMVVIWIILKSRKAPMLMVFDILAPSLMIGLAFGRVGCHLNGCCFGGECSSDNPLSSLAVTFPKYVDGTTKPQPGKTTAPMSPAYVAYVGKGDYENARVNQAEYSPPVYPSELFMSVGAFGLFWLLTWFQSTPRRVGSSILLLGIAYPIVRFTNELFRGDPVHAFGGLRISQWVSLGILAVVVPITVLFIARHRRGGSDNNASVEKDAEVSGHPVG